MLVNITKVLLIVFWTVFFFGLVQPFSPAVQPYLIGFGILMAMVHLIEFAVQYRKLHAIQAAGFNGFFQTLVFGFAYWLPLLKKDKEG